MAISHAEPKPLPAPVRHAIAKLSTEIGATPKQHAFAVNRLSGLSQAESYRRAYDTSEDKYAYIGQAAHHVAKNPKVETMLNEGKATLNILHASRGLQVREKIDELTWEAMNDEEAHWKDRLQAAKLAGSQVHVQAFSKAVDAGDAAIANLKDAISSFFSTACESGITIDATFEPIAKSLGTWQVVDSTESMPLYDPYDELDTRSACVEKAGSL